MIERFKPKPLQKEIVVTTREYKTEDAYLGIITAEPFVVVKPSNNLKRVRVVRIY